MTCSDGCDAENMPWILVEPSPGVAVLSVHPYAFTYVTSCKPRWVGRTLETVMMDEFAVYRKDQQLLRSVALAGLLSIQQGSAGHKTSVGPSLTPTTEGRPPSWSGMIDKHRIAFTAPPPAAQESPVKSHDDVISLLTHSLRPSDTILHTIHKHEPPVPWTGCRIKILRFVPSFSNLLVVQKPPGIPVTPSGRYLFSSLVEMLMHFFSHHESAMRPTGASIDTSSVRRKQQQQHPLVEFSPLMPEDEVCSLSRLQQGPFAVHPLHRIDRCTCGIVLLRVEETGRPSEIRPHQIMPPLHVIRKEYIARVRGNFNMQHELLDQLTDGSGRAVCNLPIFVVRPGVFTAIPGDASSCTTGSYRTDSWASGTGGCKQATTNFKIMSYCPVTNTSLVACEPVTGRTHQLRVHLAALGYPIVGDDRYNLHPEAHCAYVASGGMSKTPREDWWNAFCADCRNDRSVGTEESSGVDGGNEEPMELADPSPHAIDLCAATYAVTCGSHSCHLTDQRMQEGAAGTRDCTSWHMTFAAELPSWALHAGGAE